MKVSKKVIVAAAAAVVVGGVAAAYAMTPKEEPIPIGSTFLSPSAPTPITVPISINGSVAKIFSGVGGGYNLSFNGVSSYHLEAPATAGGLSFKYWAVFQNDKRQLFSDTTLVVPAGNYTPNGTLIIAYYG